MERTAAIATVALIFHSLAAVVWVGGMFFAHVMLRPAALPLEPGPRLMLWSRVLGRFFLWVIIAIVLLIATGFTMLFWVFPGPVGVGMPVSIMEGTGVLMMLLFFHLYFAPWRRFRAAVARQDFAEAGRQLVQIRTIVTVNLVLGLFTIAVGSSGRYWG